MVRLMPSSSLRVVVFVLWVSHVSFAAEPLRILTWNVESDRPDNNFDADGNDSATISTELRQLQNEFGPYDLVGLQEVRAENAAAYEQALEENGRNYRRFVSESGGSDRLVMLLDETRFRAEGDSRELESHGEVLLPGGRSRRPLYIVLTDRENDDLRFVFMNNHLTRGNRTDRQRQALVLRMWAESQSMPIVAVGDYNFDFVFENLTGNVSMAIFLAPPAGQPSVWKWVVPDGSVETVGSGADERTVVAATFIDTNWADQFGTGDDVSDVRRDRYPGSSLDFIFVGQAARNWKVNSKVIVRGGDFPDGPNTSDHRPVEATLWPR